MIEFQNLFFIKFLLLKIENLYFLEGNHEIGKKVGGICENKF